MNIIFITLLLIGANSDHIPEFKTALDFHQLNNFKQHILKPLIDLIQGLKVPLELHLEQSIPILGNVQLDVNEVFLKQLTLNWDETYMMPYKQSEDTIQLSLKNVNLTVDAFTRFALGGWQMLNTNIELHLQQLDFTLTIQFDQATTKRSWGFKPIIKDVEIALDKLQIIFEHVVIPPQKGIDAFINLITPMIVKQTKTIILKVLSPALGLLSQSQRLQMAQQFGDHMYQFSIMFTQPPKVSYEHNAYLTLQMDIQIENVDTGNTCPLFDTGDLPERVRGDQALEFIVGGNIIDQLLWLLIDSNLFKITIDDSMLELIDLPIQLTTNGMKLIIPDFYEAYGSGKGIYLRMYGHQAEQQMYIRSGRLLGALTVMLDFIVDTDSTHYPQTLDKCTTCVVAYTAEVQLGIMLTAYNKSPSTISASVMLVKIIDIDQQAGELLTVQQLNIMQTLNSLVGALLPTINQDLAKGIENPIVGHFGIKELDITMGDSFMSLGLVLDA